jgi:nucleotide-binding universal stress UspA family protein
VPNLERLLIASDDSANGKFASRLAGMLAGTRGLPTTVLHITDPEKIEARKPEEPDKNGPGRSDRKSDKDRKTPVEPEKAEPADEAKAEKAGASVKQAAEQIKSKQKKEDKADNKVDVTTIVHEAPSADVIAAEAKKGYDILIIGLAETIKAGHEFSDAVTGLGLGFEGPLAIADMRGGLHDEPDGKLNILVPVNGTEPSRRAAEVAITMARAARASLTVLYVAVRTRRNVQRGLRTRRHEEAILKDIVAIADGYNMSIRTAVLADDTADGAILNEATRRKNNLIVMGVGQRPGERLFFGDTAAALLQDSKCSLLFVAS